MNNDILIIDDSKKTIELLDLIIQEFTQYSSTFEIKKDKILNLLENKRFLYIIIDHLIDFSDEIISFILNKNPKQKIILLSDNIKCPISCDNCISQFNIVRLVKVKNISLIIHYLKEEVSFICPNKGEFDSVNTLEKLFNFINLDENIFYKNKYLFEDKILIKSSKGNISVDEVSKIDKFINESFFKSELDKDNNIIIFVK